MSTTITISEKTKKEFDKQRKLPQGTVSADKYLSYLLNNSRNKK